MVTESYMLGESPQTKAGIASATKEMLDRTNGIFPRSSGIIFTALKVDGKIIGAIEVLLKDNLGPDEISQKGLLLRTIAEVSSQAIQRAMLITKNMKAGRLAAVTKTAIAANHEINSPLTTILLKLDMLTGEMQLSTSAKKVINEIKGEAIAVRNVVKKMLEISDVVETAYAQNEKMLDLRQPEKKQPAEPLHKGHTQDQADIAGFEDYIDDQPKMETASKGAMPEKSNRLRDLKTTWKKSQRPLQVQRVYQRTSIPPASRITSINRVIPFLR
jgi:hypothetical protein